MIHTATAPTATPTSNISSTSENTACQPGIDATFAAALEHARRMTTMFGTGSSETAIAWEIVEELQSARVRSAYPRTVTPRASFIQYCEENPDAPEARIYDN